MQRVVGLCSFAIAVLFAASALGQNIATGSVAVPAAGRSETAGRAAGPPPRSASDINCETIQLEKRLHTAGAVGAITLDGALDEPAWAEAPIANGFIQND